MASILPKIKLFIFISIICLLVNIAVCTIAYASEEIILDDYSQSEDVDYNFDYEGNISESENNVTIGTFAIATGTSFVPYFSIISLSMLNIEGTVYFFIAIVLGIISTIQLFLIVIIVLNLLPKVLGSGFDV